MPEMNQYPQNTAELKAFLCARDLPYKISELGNTGLCKIHNYADMGQYYLATRLKVDQAKEYTNFGPFNLWWLEKIGDCNIDTEFPNVEETKCRIEVMQAFVDGKKIECRVRTKLAWLSNITAPTWNWVEYDYRVKPEPRVLWENEYQEIADPDVILRQVFWDELEARTRETPEGYKLIHSRKFLEISFNDATRITELEKALKLCLRVVEKGIEVRMQDQWPILKDFLEEAKTAAKEALSK